VNSKSKIKFESLPSDDPKVRCPDINNARVSLSWQPRTDLEEGLKKTIDWFRESENNIYLS
jgi:nucleoside-diphosphate-sugar epimerase